MQGPELGPRAVARVLHGLASPAFPASTWASSSFWGRHTAVDFGAVLKAAQHIMAAPAQ